MEEFLTFILAKIVDNPEMIRIEKDDNEQLTTLHITLNQNDLSRVIGKKGRTIQALRILLYTYLTKLNIKTKKVYLKVEEAKL